MAEQHDQTSNDGFPCDCLHAEDWSSKRSSEDEDTTEPQNKPDKISHTSLQLCKPFSLHYSMAGKTS